MKRCDDVSNVYDVKVIVLPFASAISLDDDARQVLRDEIDAARADDVNIVAAAGNNFGGPVALPAAHPGILSVGSTDTAAGGLCSVSAVGGTLLAPGCGLDGADPVNGNPTTSQQGTSFSAVIVAGALSALRTWRPDLSADAAQRLLVENATATPYGPALDLGAAFVAAGLGEIVPPVPTALSPAPAPPVTTPSATVAKRRLPRPRVRARVHQLGTRRFLLVRVANRPRGALLTVRVYRKGRRGDLRRVASRTRATGTIRLRVRSWAQVRATFSDPSGQRLTSLPTIRNARR
jgi:hypothetical protein